MENIVAHSLEKLYTEFEQMNQMLCGDIIGAGKYTIQRHDTRELLTINGPVRFTHTLFRNREDGSNGQGACRAGGAYFEKLTKKKGGTVQKFV